MENRIFADTITIGRQKSSATLNFNPAFTNLNPTFLLRGALVAGGTLTVTMLGGTPVGGDTFTLFSAAGGISGSFTATNLPVIPGIGWVTTNLANGILKAVATVNLNPTNLTAHVAGNVLQLSWPADHTGWRLLVQTNNLAAGVSVNTNDWTTVPGSAGINQTNITLDPAKPMEFYRLVYP